MSQIRPAHTTVLIERRLRDCEAGACDAMELVSLHDELSRVDRKWREQTAAQSPRRGGNDDSKLNGWYDRLGRQIERALREAKASPPEAALLETARAAIAARSTH